MVAIKYKFKNEIMLPVLLMNHHGDRGEFLGLEPASVVHVNPGPQFLCDENVLQLSE